jgi:hypothetical protein
MNTFKNYMGKVVEAPEDHPHIVMSVDNNTIVWSSTKAGTHRIRYGLNVRQYAGKKADIKAAKEFGLCIRHWKEYENQLQPN